MGEEKITLTCQICHKTAYRITFTEAQRKGLTTGKAILCRKHRKNHQAK